MRDGFIWSGTILVVLSAAVAVWCVRLQPPVKIAAQVASESGALPTLLAVSAGGAAKPSSSSAATCEFGELLLIAADPQPSQSAASVRMVDGTTQTRRPGETLAGYRVEAIHLDRVEFRRGAERCALAVADSRPSQHAPSDGKTKRLQLTYSPTRRRTPRRAPPSIQVL